MKNERLKGMDIQFTDAELDMCGDFSEEGRLGRHPDIEEFLKRCPGSEAKMRPILETDAMLWREMAEFRRKFPHVDLGKLLDLKHKTRPRSK
jgi:hypothetical protein